mmetsp:Transcript_1829/g.5692  ORF Transcript_1829/g.5692 Transcript_1829/m.5692 type:complete len:201 (+) Transcript_1829:1309-1911(+)
MRDLSAKDGRADGPGRLDEGPWVPAGQQALQALLVLRRTALEGGVDDLLRDHGELRPDSDLKAAQRPNRRQKEAHHVLAPGRRRRLGDLRRQQQERDPLPPLEVFEVLCVRLLDRQDLVLVREEPLDLRLHLLVHGVHLPPEVALEEHSPDDVVVLHDFRHPEGLRAEHPLLHHLTVLPGNGVGHLLRLEQLHQLVKLLS